MSDDHIRSLSKREREVLAQLVQGQTYKEIAQSLQLSPHTVRGYVERVYKQLGVHSAIQATRAWNESQPKGTP